MLGPAFSFGGSRFFGFSQFIDFIILNGLKPALIDLKIDLIFF